MKSRLSCFALAIASLFSSFAAQANLIVNGGFEEPAFVDNPLHYVHLNGAELPGWALFSTYRGTVLFNTAYDPVSEGSQAVQIEVPGDWISQSFATVIGQAFTVSFDLSAYSVYGGPPWGTPCAPTCSSDLGVTVGTIYEEFTGSSAGYSTNTLQFTADSSATTLKFENLGVLNVWGNYPHLDNVSVNAVPIPPALYLFGSGLIRLVGVARYKPA